VAAAVAPFLVGFGAGVAVTLAALALWRWIDRLPSSLAP
jgi:hypothetical protein